MPTPVCMVLRMQTFFLSFPWYTVRVASLQQLCVEQLCFTEGKPPYHTHLQVKHEPPLVLTFSFFCLLLIHIASKPFLHLHPTACRRIWPLIGQMLCAVNHCGNACGVRLLVSFFFLSCLGLTWCSMCASRQRCTSFAHLKKLRPLANGAPHGSWGPTHNACSACRDGHCCILISLPWSSQSWRIYLWGLMG